jgi:hypothetical protein
MIRRLDDWEQRYPGERGGYASGIFDARHCPVNPTDQALFARLQEEQERVRTAGLMRDDFSRGRGRRHRCERREPSLDSGIGGSPSAMSDESWTFIS